jgi:AcrR family transcriptional regulator
MVQTRRERVREATRDEIIAASWKQIAETGAPSLSLRAIAREMGMTAPGLYRYYPSRDDLVTALIIDAFNSFSDALETARDACPQDAHADRYRAVCMAYFQWGAKNPSRYLFIFGTPVSGYQMSELAVPSARRGFLIQQGVIGEAYKAGYVNPPESDIKFPRGLLARYKYLGQVGMPYLPVVTHLSLITWSTMHGITSLHLHNYLQGFLAEQVEGYVRHEIERLVRWLGLE